jgi:hypothetical protein
MSYAQQPRRRGLRKLPARHEGWVMPLFLSAFMTCVVSLISTVFSIGVSDDLVQVWLSAWGLSWIVVFPLLLIVLPLAKIAAGWVVERP